MSELTNAEALGTGIAFLPNWDFQTAVGSLDTVQGLDVLGRDLAWALQQELDTERGQRLTNEAREDIKIAVKRVARRDDRVARVITPVTVEAADDAARTAVVTLTVVAETGDRGELVLPA